MDSQNSLVGIIRYDELLNILLAIWKTRFNAASRNILDESSLTYEIGFEEGLDAIAQVAGLTEKFEASKAFHRAKVKADLNSKDKIKLLVN